MSHKYKFRSFCVKKSLEKWSYSRYSLRVLVVFFPFLFCFSKGLVNSRGRSNKGRTQEWRNQYNWRSVVYASKGSCIGSIIKKEQQRKEGKYRTWLFSEELRFLFLLSFLRATLLEAILMKHLCAKSTTGIEIPRFITMIA